MINFINKKKENLIIWDADTILLKKIDFFSGDKSINYGNFNEFHKQYYVTNKKILDDFPIYFKFNFIINLFLQTVLKFLYLEKKNYSKILKLKNKTCQ